MSVGARSSFRHASSCLRESLSLVYWAGGILPMAPVTLHERDEHKLIRALSRNGPLAAVDKVRDFRERIGTIEPQLQILRHPDKKSRRQPAISQSY